MATVIQTEFEKLLNDYAKYLDETYDNLEKLSKGYAELMTGDTNGPLWNGIHAKKFFVKAAGNMSNSIKAYNDAYTDWKLLYDKYTKWKNSGYFE